jgi:hypothetical protein
MAEIKNVADKTDLTNHDGVVDNKVNNWISQINAGGTVYDIATHHTIKFKDGNDGATTEWNGLTDIEIVIPSIKDIVQTPIEFAGTVGANGEVTWNTEHSDGPQTGYLVFVTADCTFGGLVCEAGDMAIYDGKKWNVVSGENQVSIVGNEGAAKTTFAIGASKDVLTVEGKTLALTLDYTDLNKHVGVSQGVPNAAVKFGNMTVGKTYVKLSKGADVNKTIGKSETIQKASKLADGTVTLKGTGDIVTDVTFGTFNAGSLHEIVLNEDARTFGVTGGSLEKTTTEDFVSGVTLGDVTFNTSTQGAAGAFALVGGITPGSGKSFVTGINGKTEFTVEGCLQPTDGASASYVKGIEGSYVTGLTTGGSFSLGKGSDIVIGFGSETEEKGDVISSVEVSANNDTDVLASASVTNHILSFAPVKVASGVTVTPKYKTLEKTTYSFTPASVSTTAFVNGTFTKASDVKYTFNTDNETTYTTTSAYYKLTTPKLEVSKGGYILSNTGMVANVSANTFAVNVSGGVLPSLGTSTVVKEANITGSVATGLDYTNVTINTVDPDAMTIDLPGTYSIVEGSLGDGFEVGKAGELTTKNATIDLSGYVTGVEIKETANA